MTKTHHEPKARHDQRGLTKAERDLLLAIATATCIGNQDIKDKMAAVVAECPDEKADPDPGPIPEPGPETSKNKW